MEVADMKNQSCAGRVVMILVVALAVFGLAACGGEPENVLSGPGESCAKTADCESGYKCINQVCQQAGADCPGDQECSGLECGPDPICGESCGSCDSDETCQKGQCVDLGSEDTYSPPTDSCWPDCGDEVLIPAGSFWMGCNEAMDDDCNSDEHPYHEVYLDGYYIDVTEVTQGAFKECVDAGVCDIPGCYWNPAGTPDHPVVCIDWNDAKTYCEWAGKRLPTEAEWEKAARGNDGRKYPWGNEDATCEYAVMDDGCGTGGTLPVCSKSPAGDSPYGLCDMAGNVWEWTADWYDSEYYDASPANNPTGPNSGFVRVLRGGGFFSYVYFLRVSLRYVYYPSFDYIFGLGFRCARSE